MFFLDKDLLKEGVGGGSSSTQEVKAVDAAQEGDNELEKQVVELTEKVDTLQETLRLALDEIRSLKNQNKMPV